MDWEKGSRGLTEKHRCYLRTDCNGERREEESITMIGYCNPFHNKLCFPLGPSKTGQILVGNKWAMRWLVLKPVGTKTSISKGQAAQSRMFTLGGSSFDHRLWSHSVPTVYSGICCTDGQKVAFIVHLQETLFKVSVLLEVQDWRISICLLCLLRGYVQAKFSKSSQINQGKKIILFQSALQDQRLPFIPSHSS